jgi:indole-3-glycerol phosphate synthase
VKNILEEIMDHTRGITAQRRKLVSENTLRSEAESRSSFADFAKALRHDDGSPAVIAELKKASPSKGVIRPDFQPEQLAPTLEGAGASALSVLTEPDYFEGAPEYLQRVRPLVRLPLLRKDFISESYQIYEAAVWGADAFLLIAAVLEPKHYADLYALGRECGLQVLTEVHTMAELEMVLKQGAQVVGVNARNLKTFQVDLELTRTMMGEIPREYVRVAESGIRNSQDIAGLQQAGADAFLIGETLMATPDPAETLKKLLGQ